MSRTHFRVNPPSIVWPNGWVSVYELNGSGFESSCSHFADELLECVWPFVGLALQELNFYYHTSWKCESKKFKVNFLSSFRIGRVNLPGKAFLFSEINLNWNFLGLTIIGFSFNQSFFVSFVRNFINIGSRCTNRCWAQCEVKPFW